MLCFEYSLDSGPISVCTVLADRSLTDMMAEFRKMTIFQVKNTIFNEYPVAYSAYKNSYPIAHFYDGF